MTPHRLKIILSIIISLVLVQGITYFSENPDSLSFPKITLSLPNVSQQISKLFTFNLSSLTREPWQGESKDLTTNFFEFVREDETEPAVEVSSVPGQTPTSDPKASPTKRPQATPTKANSPTSTPKPRPTSTPKPAKPTATPVPPPITSDVRPGTSLTEIFNEVNKRTCIPVPLLMAFKTKETGERFKSDSSTTIKTYNTYGWWKTGAGNPCYGYGYHTQTGIVPSDSVNAGTSCNNAVGSPNDIKIMGLMQISEWEEQTSRKSTLSSLPNNIDRRVLFDNVLIFSYITRARVGNPPKDCNNWPDEIILTAAEKHLGTCKYDYGNGNTGDYCADILKYYKQYK